MTSLAGACARWVAGDSSHGPKPDGSQMVQNDPVRGPHVLENFSRVLELKMGVFGARVSFGTQSYVYIGLRVAFR